MDKLTQDRIQLLHPKVRAEVDGHVQHINANLLGKGVRLRLAYTLRTIEEQDALFAQGRTILFDKNGKRLGKVTNAKGGQSIHNFGLAFDMVLLLDRNLDGTFEVAVWDVKTDFDKDGSSDWMEVVNYLKKHGWVWGGDWRFVDPPHFQKTFGHTWQTLQAKTKKGDTFTEGSRTWANI